MLTARPRIDLHRTCLLPLDAKSFAAAQEIFGELEAEAVRRFGVSKSAVLFDHAIEMRYVGRSTPSQRGSILAPGSMRRWQHFTPRMKRPTPSGSMTPASNR
ncbi:MAG: hypothetical protein WBD95_12270 [Xanthobacteraceae bacterium]